MATSAALVEDDGRRIIYGEFVHLSDNLLALFRVSDEFLLLIELVQ